MQVDEGWKDGRRENGPEGAVSGLFVGVRAERLGGVS